MLKSIKRTMAISAAATLMFSTMAVMPASAEGDPTVVVTTDQEVYSAGDTVTVTLSTVNNPGLNGWTVALEFDNDAFEFVPTLKNNKANYNSGSDFYTESEQGITGPSKTMTTSPATFTWGDATATPYVIDGTMVKCTLKVKEGAEAKDYEIKATFGEKDMVAVVVGDDGEPVPGQFEKIPFASESATVTVEGQAAKTEVTLTEGKKVCWQSEAADGKYNYRAAYVCKKSDLDDKSGVKFTYNTSGKTVSGTATAYYTGVADTATETYTLASNDLVVVSYVLRNIPSDVTVNSFDVELV